MNTGPLQNNRSFQGDQAWLRDANPWRVWSCYFTPILLIVILWGRQWFGWWCLGPSAITLAWVGLGSHIIDLPQTTRTWSAKTILGERIFLQRDQIPLPVVHRGLIHLALRVIAGVGLLVAIWAALYYKVWGICLGFPLYFLGQSWWQDRMVWLYEDMKVLHEGYAVWEY